MISEGLSRQAAIHFLDESLAGGHGAQIASAIRINRSHIKGTKSKGDYPKNLIDILGQFDWHKPRDEVEVFSFMAAYVKIKSIPLGILQVDVGRDPYADKNIEDNDGLIKNLPYPFSGEFFGGTQGEDGIIEIERPIHCLVYEEDKSGDDMGELVWAIAHPWSFPLEVGYISSSKVSVYFGIGTGLARWPYGQTKITIFTPYFSGECDDDFDYLRSNAADSIEIAKEKWGGDSFWDKW